MANQHTMSTYCTQTVSELSFVTAALLAATACARSSVVRFTFGRLDGSLIDFTSIGSLSIGGMNSVIGFGSLRIGGGFGMGIGRGRGGVGARGGGGGDGGGGGIASYKSCSSSSSVFFLDFFFFALSSASFARSCCCLEMHEE